MPQDTNATQLSHLNIDDYYELELSQVVERYGSLENLRVQLGTFFGTANLTALGIALSVQKAGVVLVAAAMLFVYLALDMRARALAIVYFYRGLQLQKRFVPNDEDSFLRILPGAVATEARRLSESDTVPQKVGIHSKVQKSFGGTFFRIRFTWLIMVVGLGEMATGLILWLALNWSLF